MKSLGTVFKQVYSEGLKEYGFVKIKGRQPYFVRVASNEIIHVISYVNSWSSVKEKKEYMIMAGVATVYRHEINLEDTPRNNGNWFQTLGDIYVKKYLLTEPYESMNKWNSFSYAADNEESMIESIKYSLGSIKEIMLPILDEVTDLRKCIDYYDMYDTTMMNIYVDEKFGLMNSGVEYNEGLINFKVFNTEEFEEKRRTRMKRAEERVKYLISVGGTGYTEESYKKEQLRQEERLKKTVSDYEKIMNNPQEYERVMKEMERRKEFNVQNLKKYGVYLTEEGLK